MLEKGKEKVQCIYDAVLSYMNEGVSFSQVTVKDIAARAGVGKGTIYEYFDSKEDIIAAALLNGMVEHSKKMDAYMNEHPKFEERLSQLFSLADREKEGDCRVIGRFIMLLQENSKIRKAMEERLEELYEDDELTAYLPEAGLNRMAKDAMASGEIAKAPVPFVTGVIVSHVITYILFSENQRKRLPLPMKPAKKTDALFAPINEETMLQLLMQGILKELK